MKYRKKPVVIEAFHLGVDPEPEWFHEAIAAKMVSIQNSPLYGDPCALIETKEGTMRAHAARPGFKGDWIIRGVQGELYPCKPDIFDATYEAAPPAEEKYGPDPT